MFPVDWNEWHAEWRSWAAAHASDLKRTNYRFPPKNFLADAVLGVWKVGPRIVELSEVTFPDLSGERRGERTRYIGVTYGLPDGETENGGLVDSFDALAETLGIDR